jgi:hypothetical protein
MIPQLIFAILLAADLTGVWSGDIAPSVSLTLKLDQTGDSVSGTEQIADRVFQIENARIERDKLTFTIPMPAAGRPRYVPVAATLQNDEPRLRDDGTEIVRFALPPAGPETAGSRRNYHVIENATIRGWCLSWPRPI